MKRDTFVAEKPQPKKTLSNLKSGDKVLLITSIEGYDDQRDEAIVVVVGKDSIGVTITGAGFWFFDFYGQLINLEVESMRIETL